MGATDKNVRLVVRANGLVVGVAGTVLGAIIPMAEILTMRPGLSGLSKMQLTYGSGKGPQGGGPGAQNSFTCLAGSCLANPKIQEVSTLPTGTSAPNTVITEHAVHQLGLQGQHVGLAHPDAASSHRRADQKRPAHRRAAGLTLETKSSAPSSSEIINWATVFGILLALAILAMSVGLIRSETAGDLRTLTATGAGSSARRTLTAATVGALALVGAVLGTVAAYVGAIAYAWDNALDGLSELSNIPLESLLFILVGMPLIAAATGWLLAGREPATLGHQPME